MELDDDTFESGGRDILGQFILVQSTTDIQHPIIFDTYALNILNKLKQNFSPTNSLFWNILTCGIMNMIMDEILHRI